MSERHVKHFDKRSVLEHLKKARTRGFSAAVETHGIEMPGHLAGGADAAKETAIILLLLWTVCRAFFPDSPLLLVLLCFGVGLLVWKVGRSASLGWARLERLHRLIEEERWEIEHHRSQEKEELMEMYRLKGLEGKLLEEVTDVLMADDNRLLHIMLEEELGLSLEVHEHPLKQASGAAVGSLLAAMLVIAGYAIHPVYGVLCGAFLVLCIAAGVSAKLERNRVLPTVIWNLSIGLFACVMAYYATLCV